MSRKSASKEQVPDGAFAVLLWTGSLASWAVTRSPPSRGTVGCPASPMNMIPKAITILRKVEVRFKQPSVVLRLAAGRTDRFFASVLLERNRGRNRLGDPP